jgi:signal transduction histidine kinase
MQRLVALINTGTDVLKENRKRTTVIIVNFMAIIPSALAFVMGPILFFITGNWEAWVYPWIESAVLATIVLLNSKHKFNTAALLMLMVHSFGLFFFGLLLGRAACIEGIVMFLIGLSFLLFQRWKEQIAAISFLLLLTGALEANYYYNLVPHMEYTEDAGKLMFILIFFAVAVLNILVFRFYSTDFIEWVIRLERKNDNKSDFIAKTSHDLRAPINVIDIIVKDVHENFDADNPDSINLEHEQFFKLYYATQDVKLLMNDVLSLSKMEAGSKEKIYKTTICLRDWFRKIVTVYQELGKKDGVKVNYNIDEALPEYILTDTTKLYRIIINLLSNAIKFTKANTSVTLNIYKTGSLLGVDVIDNGNGIPAENRDSIFDPYESYGGYLTDSTGLGLTISRNYAQLLGGDLTVHSQVGEGSTFSLSIQLEETTTLSVPEPAPTSFDQLNMHVLVIDDDPMCRAIAEKMLHKMVAGVDSTDNFDHALELADEQQPDLIMLDLNMPNMSGKEMMFRIKQHSRLASVPILICSGDAFEETILEMKVLGADGYIVKPILSGKLLYDELLKFRHHAIS